MTSIPASRRARAMILAPLSWPSRPTLATTTLIVRAMVPPVYSFWLSAFGQGLRALSASQLAQVVPEDVEADDQHGRDYEWPEELVDEDQGGDHGETDVGAAHQVHQAAPEAGLHEGEEGDAEDEHGDQVLPLEERYGDEANDHEAHAYGGPRLGHATEPELVFGGGRVGTPDVGAGRVALAVTQAPGVLQERLGDGLVGGEPGPEAVDLPGEHGCPVGALRAGSVEVGPAAHRREPGAELLELAALLVDLGPQRLAPRDDIFPLFEDGLYRLAGGKHLVEPGPAHGVVPGASNGLVAVVHRARRGVLTLEGIPGVEPPQPAVARDPVGDRVVE